MWRLTSCRSAHSSGEAESVGRLQGAVHRRRARLQRHLGAATTTTQLVGAGIDGDAQQPRPKGRTPKAIDVAIGGEEGLLSGVFRRLGGGQHAQAQVVDTPLVRLDEDVEGRQVALFAAGHQQRLIRRPVLQSHLRLARIVVVTREAVRVILSERATPGARASETGSRGHVM